MLNQILANGIVAGVVIAVLAVGFSILYSGSRFFVFTFGASFAWAAYAVFVLIQWCPTILAVCGGILVGAGVGGVLEWGIYRPIRQKGRSSLILMLASIGAYTVLQNAISLTFGDVTRSLRGSDTAAGHLILGARVTTTQLVTLAASVVVLAGTWLVLRGTPLGKNVRAISNDDVLARVVGINVDGTVLFSAMLGSGLAAVAGVLMSFDTNLIPTMGFQALLLGVVGAVVGGINSFGGAVLGGLLLGITQHLAVWRVPTQWQDAIVFAILVLFLILRPQGFLGKPLGRAAV